MPVLGFAEMSLEMGPSKIRQTFMVVSDLFPKVIIGIRTLKTMGVTISPTEDCAIVSGNYKLPFYQELTHSQTSIM
jgi:predicted aspartyl protease